MKPYPSYKDSGVEWIGKIPSHWSTFRVKNTVNPKCYYQIGDGDHGSIKPEMYQLEGIPYVRVQNLSWGFNLLTDGMVYIGSEIHNQNLKSKLLPGDILIAKTGATIGKMAIIPDDIPEANTTSSVGKVTADKSRFSVTYIAFSFQSKTFRDQYWLSASQKSAQPGFNIEDLVNYYLFAPPLLEQQAIAKFLDEKTQKIDRVISIKEKQIEHLKELRTAIINQAVTKGLDPNVPMKDSGVEWLGEIPEHWEVKRLRYLGQCSNGISQGADYFGSGYPFVSYGDVYKNAVLPSSVVGLAKSTDSDRENYSVRKGDVFFTRTSETIEEIGFASTCLETIENAIFAGFLIRFRQTTDNLNEPYSVHYFRSSLHRFFFVKEMNLVTRASLSQELLKRLPVLLPPKIEQQAIADYLDQKTAKIDQSIQVNQKQINQLKEYRTALISEVVTGKVDVREAI